MAPVTMNKQNRTRAVIYTQMFTIEGRDFNRAGTVATEIKSILKKIGFPPEVVRRAAIAVYEAEMNVVMYADRASVRIEVIPGEIRMQFADRGQGIEDIEQAMQEGFSTAPKEFRDMGFGAGMGLPNIRKNSDQFAIDSVVGEGTTIAFVIRIAA